MLVSDMLADRTKCPPAKMKDYFPERLPSEGGRLNENLLVDQWCRAADEKLRRLTRKPARLDDEKPGTAPDLENWAISCVCARAYRCGRRGPHGHEGHIRFNLLGSNVDSMVRMLNHYLLFVKKTNKRLKPQNHLTVTKDLG